MVSPPEKALVPVNQEAWCHLQKKHWCLSTKKHGVTSRKSTGAYQPRSMVSPPEKELVPQLSSSTGIQLKVEPIHRIYKPAYTIMQY
jgi:hypothetical protein